VRTSTLKTTEF